MQSTMMNVPLSLNHSSSRHVVQNQQIVCACRTSRCARTVTANFRRAASRALRSGLKGDRVRRPEPPLPGVTRHSAAGGVAHAEPRLAPDEIGWIAADAEDRFLIVDDILLPLYRQFADKHAFEKVIVFPFSGAPVDASGGHIDYEALLADADGEGFVAAAHDENDPIAMCYTSGTTGRPKGVVYSHRSTVLHTLIGCLADHWGLRSTDCLLPVTPMFHANSWGLPYAAVMLGIRMVFPGPHLHPDDLLDLMQIEPPTLALGVPTIWMGLIQAYDRSLVEQPGRWKLPTGMRSLVGGAAVPEALIRAFAQHGIWIIQGWGMTETSPLATVSYPRAEVQALGEAERPPPRWPASRRRWSTARARRRRQERAGGRKSVGEIR
jgi:fatty-acyl-CoA synthase